MLDFINPVVNPETSCNKSTTLTLQYTGQLISGISTYLANLKGLNKNIIEGAFQNSSVNPSDIANAFNPEANEMGQFGKIQEALSEKTQATLGAREIKTLAEGPCKGRDQAHFRRSGDTFGRQACAAINEALAKSTTKGQETYRHHCRCIWNFCQYLDIQIDGAVF